MSRLSALISAAAVAALAIGLTSSTMSSGIAAKLQTGMTATPTVLSAGVQGFATIGRYDFGQTAKQDYNISEATTAKDKALLAKFKTDSGTLVDSAAASGPIPFGFGASKCFTCEVATLETDTLVGNAATK